MIRRVVQRHPSLGMVAAALLALVATNVLPGEGPRPLWDAGVGGVTIGGVVVDGLMTAFFLAVGLEIRREVTFGTLRRPAAALTPVACALGGMLVPVAVYLVFAGGRGDPATGWAIPAATDIALAVGLLGLVAPGLSAGARAFLLTLAVADDLGGIAIIAVFYAEDVELPALLLAGVLLAATAAALRRGTLGLAPALAVLVPCWLLLRAGHVEPPIVGALLGLAVPLRAGTLRAQADALLERLEPAVTIVVLPLFTAVSASVVLDPGGLRAGVVAGVALGLLVGKPLGIMGAYAVLRALRLGAPPAGTDVRELAGLSLLAGVGFTVSLYIADVAFADEALERAAVLGVLIGSALAVAAGTVVLRAGQRQRSARSARSVA